ncbi:MAG: LPXTG cell wall anchor domain-containing protein [Lachnospiraceae bacterium]|nr:LPXTG cell wall anchor domain-containing protein [Lachnospiraceae bacterium]
MKKLITLLLTLTMVIAATCTAVSADEGTNVYVTIADGSGEIVLVHQAVSVTDIDEDGAITINDALGTAHAEFYADGADGYGTFNSDYGLSLGKLWGEENGGSYGYYVNNASAWSLTDPVVDGDHVYAFVYTDLTAWSDTYSWFDKITVDAAKGEEIELTLKCAGYDADWNPVEALVGGAEITVDGQKTGVVTDADGKAVITVDYTGEVVISAVSDAMTLVPAVCVANITAAGDAVTETPVLIATLPKTGVASTSAFVVCGIALIAAGATVVLRSKKREENA